jgi:hypothetical protein
VNKEETWRDGGSLGEIVLPPSWEILLYIFLKSSEQIGIYQQHRGWWRIVINHTILPSLNLTSVFRHDTIGLPQKSAEVLSNLE